MRQLDLSPIDKTVLRRLLLVALVITETMLAIGAADSGWYVYHIDLGHEVAQGRIINSYVYRKPKIRRGYTEHGMIEYVFTVGGTEYSRTAWFGFVKTPTDLGEANGRFLFMRDGPITVLYNQQSPWVNQPEFEGSRILPFLGYLFLISVLPWLYWRKSTSPKR